MFMDPKMAICGVEASRNNDMVPAESVIVKFTGIHDWARRPWNYHVGDDNHTILRGLIVMCELTRGSIASRRGLRWLDNIVNVAASE
jgi:hypothetical protein